MPLSFRQSMPPSLFGFYTSRAYSNNRGRTHSGCRTAADAQDSEPGKRVTGAGTAYGKPQGKGREGAAHRASPPCQRRDAPGSILRAQKQSCRWVDGVTWHDYEVNLECKSRGSRPKRPPRSASASSIAPDVHAEDRWPTTAAGNRGHNGDLTRSFAQGLGSQP